MRAVQGTNPFVLARALRARAMSNSDVERPVVRMQRNAIRVRSVGWVERSETHPLLRALVGFASLYPPYEARFRQEIKGSGTPADAGRTTRTHTACGARHGRSGLRRAFRYRPRSPAGVPPRLFPRGVWSLGAIRARFRGQVALPTSSDAPRMPVVMPADMMPGPPGSKADEASPAGTALAPAARHHPDGVPTGRDDSLAIMQELTKNLRHGNILLRSKTKDCRHGKAPETSPADDNGSV